MGTYEMKTAMFLKKSLQVSTYEEMNTRGVILGWKP